MERFLSNYMYMYKPLLKASERILGRGRKYKNEHLIPSWIASFVWLEFHVMNNEAKMFCNICRRYDEENIDVLIIMFKLREIQNKCSDYCYKFILKLNP